MQENEVIFNDLKRKFNAMPGVHKAYVREKWMKMTGNSRATFYYRLLRPTIKPLELEALKTAVTAVETSQAGALVP